MDRRELGTRLVSAGSVLVLWSSLLGHPAGAAHVGPVFVDGNPRCDDGLTELKIENGDLDEATYGDGALTIVISNLLSKEGEEKERTGFDWSSNIGLTEVIVKASSGANVYTYDPAATGDSGLETPVANNGKNFGISHLSFCYDPDPEPEPTPTPTSTPTPTPAEADLELSVSGPDGTVTAGDEFAYTIAIDNHGPDAATGLTLTGALAEQVAFVSAVPPEAGCVHDGSPNGGALTCDGLGGLDALGVTTVEIVVSAETPGTADSTVEVTAAEADPDATNNSASIQTTIQAPAPAPAADLEVRLAGPDGAVAVGDEFTYTVEVTNNGPDAATDVALKAVLADQVTFVSASPAAAGCSHDGSSVGGTVTCAGLGGMAPGAVKTVQIVASARTPGTAQTTLAVAAIEADPAAANNSSSIQTTIEAAPAAADLEVGLTGPDGAVTVGDVFAYTVEVTNNGPDAASGVTLTGVLPEQVAFVSAAPSGAACLHDGSATGGAFECAGLASLDAVAATAVEIVVSAETIGTADSTVEVAATESDTVPANNTAVEQTVIEAPRPISIQDVRMNGGTSVDEDGRFRAATRNTGGPVLIEIARATCPGGEAPHSVTAMVTDHAGDVFTVALTSGPSGAWSGTWQSTPGPDGARANVSVRVVCPEGELEQEIGFIELFDPSGVIRDAITGCRVFGARVELQRRVEAGVPVTDPSDLASGGFVFVSPGPIMDPQVNPQFSDTDGRYGWDVATGWWRIVVSRDGYVSQTSRQVFVPPAVTDLDIDLVPTGAPNVGCLAAPPPSASAPAPSPPPSLSITVEKTNDADDDGAFNNVEAAATERQDVAFQVAITNTSPVAVRITRLAASFDGGLIEPTCLDPDRADAVGQTLGAGDSLSCVFVVAKVAPPSGRVLRGTATVDVVQVGDPTNSASGNDDSTVITPGLLAIEIDNTNDADGDGRFGDIQEAPAEGRDVVFRILVTNPGQVELTIVALTDVFGGTTIDLLADGLCDSLNGWVLAPGEQVRCDFTLPQYSPSDGEGIVNTVEVVGARPSGGLGRATASASDQSAVLTVVAAEASGPPVAGAGGPILLPRPDPPESAFVGMLPRTGIEAQHVSFFGLLLMLAGTVLMIWTRRAEALPGIAAGERPGAYLYDDYMDGWTVGLWTASGTRRPWRP